MKPKVAFLYVTLIICIGFVLYFGISLGQEIHTTGQGRAFYATLPVYFMPQEMEISPCWELEDVDGTVDLDDLVKPLEEFQPLIDFQAKREIFPSIIGWIQSEGTVINYPIVQGANNEFYLHHLPDGVPHPWGAIFLDYRNSGDFSDASNLIYGHNMRSGDMFGSLKQYKCHEFLN